MQSLDCRCEDSGAHFAGQLQLALDMHTPTGLQQSTELQGGVRAVGASEGSSRARPKLACVLAVRPRAVRPRDSF